MTDGQTYRQTFVIVESLLRVKDYQVIFILAEPALDFYH